MSNADDFLNYFNFVPRSPYIDCLSYDPNDYSQLNFDSMSSEPLLIHNSKQITCQLHMMPVDRISITNGRFLCRGCIYHESCWDNNHHIEYISDVQQKATDKVSSKIAQKKALNNYICNLNEFCTESEKRGSVLIKRNFENLQDLVERQEEAVFSEIALDFIQKNRKLNKVKEKVQAFHSVLDTRMNILSSNNLNKQYVDAINQSVEGDVFDVREQELLQSEIQVQEQHLDTAFQGLNNNLADKLQSFVPLSSYEDPSYLSKHINDKFYHLHEFLNIREGQDDYITISPSKYNGYERPQNFNKLNTATKVTLDTRVHKLTTEALNAICYIWTELKNVREIHLDLSCVEDEELEAISGSRFWSSGKINEVSINLAKAKVSDSAIRELLVNRLSEVSHLVRLELDLSQTKLTEETVVEFAKATMPEFTRLESLSLNLAETLITKTSIDTILSIISCNLKGLKKLKLDARKTLATEADIRAIDKRLSPAGGIRSTITFVN